MIAYQDRHGPKSLIGRHTPYNPNHAPLYRDQAVVNSWLVRDCYHGVY